MDDADCTAKAQRFSQIAFSAALGQIAREYGEKRKEARARLAARGAVLSGAMIREDALIDAAQITATAKALLSTRLEGYEMFSVPIHDQLANSLTDEVWNFTEQKMGQAQIHAPGANTFPAGTREQYPQLVRSGVEISPAWIKTEIDRKRFMKRPQGSTTNVYHIEGDNSRVNVNSTDNSVNVVVKSSDQIFANLRQQIESRVPEGVERKKIIDGLTALEGAQGSKSFTQRYTEFIEVAANHMELLGPFIPALTEMLRQAL